jgi:hypothetical protein
MQRRAEIALRSLSQTEKGQLERALNKLTSLSPAEFYIRPEIQKLISASGENLILLSEVGDYGLFYPSMPILVLLRIFSIMIV